MKKPAYLKKQKIREFIQKALAEDIGDGDHSSRASIPKAMEQEARLIIKDEGILAGVDLAEMIFREADKSLKISLILKDGSAVKKGDIAFTVKGKARSILTAERLVLNCMQRMSGIATITNRMSTLIAGTKAKLLDTRKTTPNFRISEKWAVLIGGGLNHRFGLFDMIILKDNHIDYSGGLEQAIQRTKKYLRKNKLKLKIEVETRNIQEVARALEVGGIHRIMLDNMDLDQMKEAVKLINGKYETEASGGITEKNIKQVAETGVDYISVGALTHSAPSLDMSLKAIN